MASKYSEAVRALIEADLECPFCGAYNVHGQGGKHIHLDAHGLAVCTCCGKDFVPNTPRE